MCRGVRLKIRTSLSDCLWTPPRHRPKTLVSMSAIAAIVGGIVAFYLVQGARNALSVRSRGMLFAGRAGLGPPGGQSIVGGEGINDVLLFQPTPPRHSH